jgi:membrane protein
MFSEDIQPKLEHAARWMDKHSGGIFSILRLAIKRFIEVRGPEAAASIAYYAIFSLFPLILLFVSITGFLLVSEQTQAQVLALITQAVPISNNFVRDNLRQILEARNTGGIIGLVALLWAASGVFLAVARNINRAWPRAHLRNIVQGRLVAMAIIAGMGILLLLSLAASTLFKLLPEFNIPIRGSISIYDTFLWQLLTNLIPWLVSTFVFYALYRWIPNTLVKGWEAFWGALVATVLWQGTTELFTWFLRSNLANYQILYGSLGTILALLTWIYLTGMITLFGAHISSAVAQMHRLHPEDEQV